MQKVYTTRDDMYIQVDRLCRLAGVTGPSSFSPISARGLEIALNRIDPASLSEKEQKEYGRLKAELTGNYLFSSDGFDFNLNTGVNVGVNIADYSNFDFSNSDGIAPDRRNEALLQYRFEIPAIYIHPAFNFGDYVYMEANFALQNNNHHMYETTFGWLLTSYNGHLSVFGSEGPTNPPGELPLRAGLSIGNDNLSGGQQFRMVLMRTLLTDAKIILIDNNFMSVDSKLREKIFEYLKKSGKTIVFTDHLYRNEYKEFSVIEV